mgnify:FL=1
MVKETVKGAILGGRALIFVPTGGVRVKVVKHFL